ncbi:MAG: SDR family oxidoreductase [Planctomycetota bacterium]
MPQLAGLHAVVTGASSGIGRAIALEFAAAGAQLSLHARSSAQALQQVAGEAGGAATHLADLGQHGAGAELVASVWDRSPIDIWVHNAGADVLTGDAAAIDFGAKLDLLWQVDVRGTIETCRAVGERMRERGRGVILTIGWDQAEVGMEGDPGEMFGTTKGAVMAFTKALAKSLAPSVRVNCLAPGWIKTKWGDDAPDYWRERAQREALVGRWGEPADVAAAACYLASPAASFVTGCVLPVNGGFSGALPRAASDSAGG